MNKNKKILSAVAVLALSGVTAVAAFSGCKTEPEGEKYNEYGSTYYVSAQAETNGTGAKNNPMKIDTLLGGNILKPGDTVLVQPGVYKLDEKIIMSKSGTYKHNITVKNAGAAGEKAVLDFSNMEFASTNRGIELYSDYVYWYGIDICGAGDNGLYVGGSYNTIEYSEFYNNRDTGLQLGRQDGGHKLIHQWPSYNLIKNCTSHNNYDNETYGENADGFAAKLTVGYGNVFDGCIAYRNSDDGWDLYAKSDSGNIGQVIMYNCVAFENGYLEYTQAECNALYPSFRTAYAESNTNSYKTRDGDGNGFKLGGSVMVGDVLLYNCLSYANRMHGVTDNSNPGYLYVEGVTSYDNSAAIDNDSQSATFGQVIDQVNHDDHNNIDVARNTYSYNTVKNTLSVSDSFAKSLGKDEYRGSVTDSILLGTAGANKISGTLDADTNNAGKPVNTELTANLVATEVFEALPYTKGEGGYTYNLSGLKDMGADYRGGAAGNDNRVHLKYRNADGSVNMGNILAVKDYSKLLGETKIGSVLNKTRWEDYTHFTEGTMPEEVKSSIAATLAKTKETLYLDTDAGNCYQNFKIPTLFNLCNVSWTSANEDILKIGSEYDISLSGSEYVWVDVNRPEADTKVKLTATISLFGRSVDKEFEVTVKKDAPEVGALYVVVGTTGETIRNDGTIIFDGYQQFEEPAVKVTNGAYKKNDLNIEVNKLLREDQYNLITKYEYATEDGKPYKTVAKYTPNVAGVYRITHTVTLKDNETSKNTMTYKIFVASTDADLAWSRYDSTNVPEGGTIGADIASINVNRHGFTISGRPNSAIGHVYAFTDTEDKTVTAADFYENADEKILKEGVSDNAFRATSISYQYQNANNAAYYIYYAFANGKGEITHLYKESVSVINIDSIESFKKIAAGQKIGDEDPSHTIYMLTTCLDFKDVKDWKGGGSFKGVLNGAGHTISNFSVVGSKVNEACMFDKFEGGTLMNIKFENVSIDGSNKVDPSKPFKQVGLVSRCYGGYFYNIRINGVAVKGGQSVGGLIGQVYENAPTYIEKVSVVNTDDTKVIDGPGNSVGGIIGLIQTNSSPVSETFNVYISECYTNVTVGYYRYSGGIVGRFDTQKVTVKYTLEINKCVSAGSMYATYNSAGGIIGAQQGNGTVKLSNCLFIGKLYHTYDTTNPRPLATSQKNASGMFGGFIAAADVTIRNCVSIIPEYNTAYQEDVLFEDYFERKSVIEPLLGEEGWTYHLRENDTNRLDAPYVSLDFAGEWECTCNDVAE